MSDAVPYSKFSTEMVDPKLRRDAWIESMKPIYDISPVEKQNSDFNGSSQVWEAGDLFFGSIAYDAQIMDHSRGKHNRTGENDYLFMMVYRQGGARSIHDGKPMEYRPNDVQILDFPRDHRLVAKRSRVEGVWIPYEAVDFEPNKHARSTTLSTEGSPGSLLSELSAMIFKELRTTDLQEAKAMARMLTGTLKSLISHQFTRVAKEQSVMGRRVAMHHFVVENIHDLSLNVETLCRKFGVSRATVFRDFEPGGLQNFMMLHRLDRALNDIARGPAIRGRIALIAEKWGFSSPAHFSRLFRETFGFSPSDAVGLGREVEPVSPRDFGVDCKWTRWIK